MRIGDGSEGKWAKARAVRKELVEKRAWLIWGIMCFYWQKGSWHNGACPSLHMKNAFQQIFNERPPHNRTWRNARRRVTGWLLEDLERCETELKNLKEAGYRFESSRMDWLGMTTRAVLSKDNAEIVHEFHRSSRGSRVTGWWSSWLGMGVLR